MGGDGPITGAEIPPSSRMENVAAGRTCSAANVVVKLSVEAAFCASEIEKSLSSTVQHRADSSSPHPQGSSEERGMGVTVVYPLQVWTRSVNPADNSR